LTARADGSPCIKVLDFGISKVTNPSGSGSDMGMTRTQSVMGSPLYMSPEQMASARDVDQRTDIWAVGCVLYELVTGRVPFEAETMPQLCTLILHAEPPPPRSIRADIPELLEQVILRCLRKDRNQRYPNVAALAQELAGFAPDAGPRSAERISKVLSSSGIISPELSSSHAARAAGANTGSQAWGNTKVGRRSRAVWLSVLGLAAALVIGVVAWKASHAHGGTSDVSASAAAQKASADALGSPSAAQSPPPVESPRAPATPPSSSNTSSPPAGESSAVPNVSSSKGAHPVRPGVKPKLGDGKPKSGGGGDVDPLSERN
jgi:serine/threonine-protein kinase